MATLVLPFKVNAKITQVFGNKLYLNGVDVYGQWGLKGHNGIDYGLSNDTKLYAPHSGTVIDTNYDKAGYGHYVKIQNNEEGSVLGHMRSVSVKKNDIIKQGQLIGYSNNSGYSTGPHLHWGYYRIPKNNNNGYAGYIDQTPYLVNDLNEDMIKDFLISKGYAYPEAHPDVVKALYESDMKLKSGDYISKKDYNTEITNLKDSNKNDIENAVNNAKKEWKVDSLEEEVTEYRKISQTIAYKMAINVEKFLEVLKKFKIGGNNG